MAAEPATAPFSSALITRRCISSPLLRLGFSTPAAFPSPKQVPTLRRLPPPEKIVSDIGKQLAKKSWQQNQQRLLSPPLSLLGGVSVLRSCASASRLRRPSLRRSVFLPLDDSTPEKIVSDIGEQLAKDSRPSKDFIVKILQGTLASYQLAVKLIKRCSERVEPAVCKFASVRKEGLKKCLMV